MRDRRFGHHTRAEHVVEHRLPGVLVFHQGHVFVGGRMEHHRREVGCQHMGHLPRVGDAADDRRNCGVGEALRKFLFHGVQGELAVFQQHDALRPVTRDLAAQFRADGPAGAGDQHHLLAQPFAQPRGVELHRVAAEQVVELDIADLRHRDPAAEQIVEGGHRQHP